MIFFLKRDYLMVFKSKLVCFSFDCINVPSITLQSGFVGGHRSVNAFVIDVKKRNSRVIDSFIIAIIVIPS